MNLDTGNSIKLDVKQYEKKPRAAAFAKLVRREVERRRSQLGEQSLPPNVLTGLLDPVSFPIARPWFHFLTDVELIDRSCAHLKVTRVMFLSLCIDLLGPPNWETLFWLRAYLEAVNNEVKLMTMSELREAEAEKRASTALARKGGDGRVRADPRTEAKQFVQARWEEWQRDPTMYFTKAEFAREMRLRPQCSSLVGKDNRTITEWCRKFERNAER